MQQSRVFVGMVLILIFGEVLGLYGYVFFFPASVCCRISRHMDRACCFFRASADVCACVFCMRGYDRLIVGLILNSRS